MTEDEIIDGIRRPGKFDATVGSEDDARRVVRTALPDAAELAPAVAGQPYPPAPKGAKQWFQVHPADVAPTSDLPKQPHVKYADWSRGKRGKGGSWGHIFFPPAEGS
jgi:hypothetical protein